MSSSGGSRGGGSAAITGTMQGTAAARPAAAAAPAGALYWATDTNEISVNNLAQTAWQRIGRVAQALALGDINSSGSLTLGPSGVALSGDSSGTWFSTLDFDVQTAGHGIRVKEGANAKQQTYGPLVAGTLAVANTSITANSRIWVCRSPGGTNPGAHFVSAQTAGTGYTVTSTNAADTGGGVALINEPG